MYLKKKVILYSDLQDARVQHRLRGRRATLTPGGQRVQAESGDVSGPGDQGNKGQLRMMVCFEG